jgi:hypothetical protein
MALIDFLKILYAGAAPDECWTFCHKPDAFEGMFETAIPVVDADGAVRLVDETTRQGQHLWLRSATGGSQVTEQTRQYFVFVDLDLLGPGHRSEQLPIDEGGFDAALVYLGLPRPTFAVKTGGGYQYFWRLAAPQTPDARLCRALQAAIRRELGSYHLDSTSGVNQLFRVPGGRNYKPAYGPSFPLVEVVEANPSHTVTAAQLLGLATAPTRAKTTPAKTALPDGPHKVRRADSVLAGCRRLREAGENPETQTYNQWLCAAAIFAACDDLDGFLDWSTGYPDFDEMATRVQFSEAKRANTGATYARITEVFGDDPEDPFEAGGTHSPLSLGSKCPAFIKAATEWIYHAATGSYLRIRDGYELPAKLWDDHIRGEVGIGRPLHLEMRNWPHAPKVERVQYLVGQPRFPGNGTLNTWTRGGVAPVEGDWSGVKGFLWHMFPVPEERELILDALAFHLQNPSEKIIWAPLLTGAEGTGKSFVFDRLLPGLIGEANRGRVTGDVLAEKFTASLANWQILCINELRQPKGFEASTRIKEFVTEDMASIRPMRQERMLAPSPRWVWASSNERVPLPMTTRGRRWFATEYMRVAPQQVANAFYDRDPDAQIAAFAHYMLSRDVGHFNHKDKPFVTETQQSIARQTRPGFEGLIQDGMEAKDGPLAKPCGTAREIRDWLRRNGEGKASDKAVTGALTNLGAVMVGGLQAGDSLRYGRANIWAWDRIDEIRAMSSRERGRLLDGDGGASPALRLILTEFHGDEGTANAPPPLGSRGDEDNTQLRSSGGGR